MSLLSRGLNGVFETIRTLALGDGTSASAVFLPPTALSTSLVHAPASNTAAVVTISAAGAGVSNVISGVVASYSGGTPTAGNLKIEDGSGTTVFTCDVTAAGPLPIVFPRPIKGSANTQLIVTLAAGGSGVSGKVNVLNKWTE